MFPAVEGLCWSLFWSASLRDVKLCFDYSERRDCWLWFWHRVGFVFRLLRSYIWIMDFMMWRKGTVWVAGVSISPLSDRMWRKRTHLSSCLKIDTCVFFLSCVPSSWPSSTDTCSRSDTSSSLIVSLKFHPRFLSVRFHNRCPVLNFVRVR